MLHRRKIIFITIVVFIIVLCLIYSYVIYREKYVVVTDPCSNETFTDDTMQTECISERSVKTQYSSKSTQSGTASIRVPPVPMLDAAMIQSTASNTAYTTSLAPGATLTVPCGSTPSHIHHGLVAPLGSAVNGMVNYTLSYYDTLAGTQTATGTCNVVWDTQTIGQTAVATIRLPDSLRITASDELATLSLNATSNGIQLYGLSVPDPVTGSPVIMHHLAGIPQNMITGAMYVPSSFPPQLAEGTWRVPDELGSYESTAQETSVEQDSITINATVSWNVPTISFFMTMNGTNTFSENVGNYLVDNGASDESFQLAYSAGTTNGLSGNVSSSALTDLQIPGVVSVARYQLVTVPLDGAVLNGNSIVLSNPLAVSDNITGMFTPNAIQPDTVLVDATGAPYYIIGKTSFITRPVGRVTPEQPDVYDTGCYLGADMATGNCVTQRSNSTACRQNSLCLINSCTIVGTTAPCIGMDSMETFSPVSEDYGATASIPKSIMPKAWPLPKNMNKLNAAVPQHMLDKSVMAIDTCTNGMYYIPQNTQVDREGLPVNTLYDLYTISVGANNPCPGPGDGGYPALGDGANGCGPTSAVCSPNTVPTQVPTVGACGDILGNCYYICANSHYSCTAGFVSVDGECYRSPPITLDPSQLSSNMLCSMNLLTSDGDITICSQNGISVPTFFNSSEMEANGWRIDPSSCTGGTTSKDDFGNQCPDPISDMISPFSVDDSIGTATNPIPCGYYYWPSSTPSYQLFNVGIYGQSQCTEPAGCTDAIPSYSLGWSGGWVGNT